MLNNFLPIFTPTKARAEAPTPSPSTATPVARQRKQPPLVYSTPDPHNLPPEVEKARARLALETAWHKYQQYHDARGQTELSNLRLEGDWAYAVVKNNSRARRGDSAEIHLLAKRLADGTWQALLPDDDQYLPSLNELPDSLISANQKSRLRYQDGIQHASTVTPIMPMPVTSPLPGPVKLPQTRFAGPTATPTLDRSKTEEERILDAVRQVLVKQNSTRDNSDKTRYEPTVAFYENNWAYVELVIVNIQTNELVPTLLPPALLKFDNNKWSVALANTVEYGKYLNQIPDTLLRQEVKSYLKMYDGERVERKTPRNVSGYKLPWVGIGSVGCVESVIKWVNGVQFCTSVLSVVKCWNGWVYFRLPMS